MILTIQTMPSLMKHQMVCPKMSRHKLAFTPAEVS